MNRRRLAFDHGHQLFRQTVIHPLTCGKTLLYPAAPLSLPSAVGSQSMSLPFPMSRLLRGVAAVALVAPVLVATLPAHAAVLTADDILGQFNAVVTDNFSTNSDVEGRLVAGNINNSGSSTFYEKPKSFEFAVLVSGRERLDHPELPGLQRQQWRRRQLRYQQCRHVQFQWRRARSPKTIRPSR